MKGESDGGSRVAGGRDVSKANAVIHSLVGADILGRLLNLVTVGCSSES